MLPLLQLCVPGKLLSQPVGPNENLIKSIVVLTANIARNSLLHLQNRDFKQFDALVGENTCQLRAYHVQRNGVLPNERILELLQEIGTLHQQTLTPGFFDVEVHSKEQISQRINWKLKESPLQFTIEELFLIISHMLYVVRAPVEGRADRSEPTNLRVFLPAEEGNLDDKVLTDIMFMAKKSLAELSAKYAQNLANELLIDKPIKVLLSDLMSKKNQKTKQIQGQPPLVGVPCFFSIFIILEHLQERNGSLTIRVQREGGNIDIPIFENHGPKMIVEGVSQKLDEEAIQQKGLISS